MHDDRLVRLIGAFKLVKAAVLIAIGAGALEHIQHDVARTITSLAANHHLQHWIAMLDGTSDRAASRLGIAALIYAALFLVEGLGLLARKVWAEWLTVVITGSFIPIEIYELVEHRSATKAIVTLLNVAIVIYLLARRLRGTKPVSQPRPT